jgi:3-oxoacyl-[acyl-carrier-protein] synthase-3
MTDERSPRIRSIGTYVPEERESNAEMADRFGFSDDFLERKLGFLARATKEPGESRADLCIRAFEDLCSRADVDAEAIQLAVVVTQHPDVNVPHMAAIVHNRLRLAKHCMTFDISQGCAGYCHALTIMIGVMETAHLDHAILFTSDPYSDLLQDDDRDVSMVFGDAATASYIARSGSGYQMLDSNFGTLPDSHRCLFFDEKLEMDGNAVFKYAGQSVPPSITTLLERNGLTIDDVDCFLMHQAARYMVDFVRQRTRIPVEKAPFEAADYGNTISSSIPLMFQKRVEEAELETILLSGFGVGFTWGNNLMKLVCEGFEKP